MTAQSSHPKKILIVDDDPQVGRAVGDYLQRHGFSIELANGGQQGVLKAMRQRPDLIICDINMPDLDGRSVVKMLRQHFEMAQIPVVFLSAYGDHSIIRQSMNLGGDDYLVKPTDPLEILETIQARLARGEQMQKRANKQMEETVRMFLGIINDLDPSGAHAQWCNTPDGVGHFNLEHFQADLAAAPRGKTPQRDDKLLVKKNNKQEFIQLSQVKVILAASEYSKVCWGDNCSAMFRKAIRTWAKELPPVRFIRIHRSTIINLDFFDRVETLPDGSRMVYVRGIQNSFRVSLRARPALNKALKHFPQTPAARR